MIKVSVVIATYKRPNETQKCLDLLDKSEGLNRDYQLEVLVIDSSPDILTKTAIYKSTCKFDVKYIKLKKKTLPGEARTLAIKKANDELIIILDSDIEVKNDTILKMIQYMKNHPLVARMTGKSIFSSGEKKGQVDRPTKWDRIYKQGDISFIEGIYGRYEIFYKAPFLNINGYDEIFGACGEGTDISVRFWRAGYPLALDDTIIAHHNSEAPESLRRSDPDRMTSMYRSLFLVAYKYDVSDFSQSRHFIETHQERKAAYGEQTEFHAIVSAARSIEWFKKNYGKLINSKKNIPKIYDFKPFDIFTNQELLKRCLSDSKKRIEPFYQKAFITD